MVESVLFFSLGFLCAGFIALLLAPAVQRRAERLTRRRIEATVPLTLNEIQADKDRMRAEFAMTVRRLEMSANSYREQATAQTIEINRKREELRALTVEHANRERALSEIEAQASELRTKLERREEELKGLSEKLAQAESRLADAEGQLKERTRELEALRHAHDEVTLEASSRQIEIVGRESEIENLTGTITELKAGRAEAEQRLKQVIAENLGSLEALAAEKERASTLEVEVERLKTAISAGEGAASGTSEERLENALLRERMLDLAAQVVSMTARLDGPDSPIGQILTRTGESTVPANEPGEKMTSLADRIKALQGAEAGH